MAELSIASLWGTVDEFADRASLAVYLAPATLLTTSSGEAPAGLLDAFAAKLRRRNTGQDPRSLTVVQAAGQDFHARVFDYPLARSFQAPALRVLAWEPVQGTAATLSTQAAGVSGTDARRRAAGRVARGAPAAASAAAARPADHGDAPDRRARLRCRRADRVKRRVPRTRRGLHRDGQRAEARVRRGRGDGRGRPPAARVAGTRDSAGRACCQG